VKGEPLRPIAFVPGADRLLAAGPKGRIALFESSGGREVAALPVPAAEVRALAVSPDGRRFVAGFGGERPALRVFSLETLREVATLPDPPRDVSQAEFSPDGKLIVAAGVRARPRIWDAGGFRHLADLDCGYWDEETVTYERFSMAATEFRDLIALREGARSVVLWDLVRRTRFSETPFDGAGDVLLSGDGAWTGVAGAVAVEVRGGGSPEPRFGPRHGASIGCSAAGGGFFATGAGREIVVGPFSDPASAQRIGDLPAVPVSLAFSGDGLRLAAGCEDGSLLILRK
jgi:WD40 repeat protein